jgi:hypothetical protein
MAVERSDVPYSKVVELGVAVAVERTAVVVVASTMVVAAAERAKKKEKKEVLSVEVPKPKSGPRQTDRSTDK